MKIFIVLLLGLVCLSCGKSGGGSDSGEVSQETLRPGTYMSLLNKHRKSLKLSPLKYSLIIESEAKNHTEDMARERVRFGHSGFNLRCARIKAELRGELCGEIVARGQDNESEVLKSWLGSTPHRKTIENPQYSHTGLFMKMGQDGRKYWTQIFLAIP